MAWLSRVNFTASDVLSYTDLNNLGNDIRAWGGNVNGGAYMLSNVVLSASSGTMATVIGGTGTTSTLTLRSTSGVGTTGADIIFQTGNNGATEVMRLQNGGNVGIGTPSPQTLLTVGSYTSGTGEATTRGYIQIQDPFESASLDGSRGLEFKTSPGGSGYGWKMGGVGAINFAIGNRINSATFTERMRIDASGNVGIGTSSVATKLVVLDTNRVVDASGNVNIYTSDNQAAGLGGVLGLGGKNGSGATDPYVFATLRGAKENSTSSNYAGYMSMHTTTSAGVVTERMRIDSVGNVKVGGTADRATTAGTNQVVIFNGTAPVGTLSNGCSFYSTAGEMRVMDAAGNATLLSPHDSVTNEWIYDSSHTPSGKRLKINVERLLRFINDHFGLDCVHDLMEEA